MNRRRLFVGGMLRSGTSLAQTLLTNHPDMLVAYQPFNQLYVDIKQLFLDEHGIEHALPLDNGDPADHRQRSQFLSWLSSRRFSATEARGLARRATTGKGGGLPSWQVPAIAGGSFDDVHAGLHDALARELQRPSCSVVGSKEILCEEYVPALVAAGVRCVLIIRDPRGVIASAHNGRYRAMVGDRYPLMMLIRLWRKSAAYWLNYRGHPGVYTIRYEDLAVAPREVMAPIAEWLGVAPYPPQVLESPLRDHAGRPWSGNSSFEDKSQVDPASRDTWRHLLPREEQDFITACTLAELRALGYPCDPRIEADRILDFREDTAEVRSSYLQWHPIDTATRLLEAERFRFTRDGALSDPHARRHFLFPDAVRGDNLHAATDA